MQCCCEECVRRTDDKCLVPGGSARVRCWCNPVIEWDWARGAAGRRCSACLTDSPKVVRQVRKRKLVFLVGFCGLWYGIVLWGSWLAARERRGIERVGRSKGVCQRA